MMTWLSLSYAKNPLDDLEELVLSYNKTLRAVLDKHAPVETRTIVVCPQVPWCTNEIRESDGKLKEDGDYQNLILAWLSSKLM